MPPRQAIRSSGHLLKFLGYRPQGCKESAAEGIAIPLLARVCGLVLVHNSGSRRVDMKCPVLRSRLRTAIPGVVGVEHHARPERIVIGVKP